MKPLLLFIVLFISSLAFAQKTPGSVKGILQDSTGEALPDATVSVMGAKDSSLISFTLTSNSGFFEIKNIDTVAYYLIISYGGFETLKKTFRISAEKPMLDLAALKLEKKYNIEAVFYHSLLAITFYTSIK